MQQYNKGYDPSEYEDEEYQTLPDNTHKTIVGYRIVIIILSVILLAVSMLYYTMYSDQQAAFKIERDSLTADLGRVIADYDSLKISNDTIAANLMLERGRADSLLTEMKKFKSWSYREINKYKREIGTMRTIMKGYIHQIDSLNTLNKKLAQENVTYRREVSTVRMRAERAEERAEELNNMVKVGSVIKARDIRMEALNQKGNPVSRIKNAARLRVDFVLSANELATPGNRAIYLRITAPDGYVLTTDDAPTFEFEGDRLNYSAMREVDYQNQDLEVGIFFNSRGFAAGTYRIELFCEGRAIGSAQVVKK